MRDKAINEVARPVSDNELDDNDEEEHYDTKLLKLSFLNEKMALDTMEQMCLFAEERELKELSKMVLKITTYLEEMQVRKRKQSFITDCFNAE